MTLGRSTKFFSLRNEVKYLPQSVIIKIYVRQCLQNMDKLCLLSLFWNRINQADVFL